MVHVTAEGEKLDRGFQLCKGAFFFNHVMGLHWTTYLLFEPLMLCTLTKLSPHFVRLVAGVLL